jgi:4-aminobutyrate aminotransferase-like enzyme/Ser/Thr protein kinase RdoA (MazF antagonist)
MGTVTNPLAEARPYLEPEAALSLLERHWGRGGELSSLHGERDLNFRVECSGGERYVLKVHNPADPAEVVAMRSEAIAHIQRVDPLLPVAGPVPDRDGRDAVTVIAADGRPSVVQLFELLPGRHPSREELTPAALVHFGAVAARLGRALRGFFHAAARYEIDWDLRHTASLAGKLDHLTADERELVLEVLERFSGLVAPRFEGLRAQVVHNDLSRTNLLVDSELRIVGITDFGDATHTALVCDLAIALADLLDGRPDFLDLAPHLVGGYRSVVPLERDEAELLGDLVAARLATALALGSWMSRCSGAAAFPGALELLRLMSEAGYDAVAEHLRRAAQPESTPGPRPASRSTPELLAARRQVLGPLELSYDEPLHLVRGEGPYLYDAAGRRYLDAYNNVPVLGHCHPVVAEAMAGQARRLVTNTRYLHESTVELAEALVASAPPGLDRVLFVNSGSEATDVAWRIAQHATGREGAVVTAFAYHGVTAAATELSPEEWPPGTAPPSRVALVVAPGPTALAAAEPPHAAHLDLPAAAAALRYSSTGLAALFVDPAFTSDGILGPAAAWLERAAAAVAAEGGLLVADEVQAGYGRTGEGLWSIAASGVAPDLMTLGKPMGNGFPVAAVLGRAEHVDPFVAETGYFSTFGGSTLAAATALAVLGCVRSEGLVARARAVGDRLLRGLEDLAREHGGRIGAVRGFGLLVGVEIVAGTGGDLRPDPAAARAVVEGMRRRGVLVGRTGPAANVVKIRPPLVIGEVEADEVVDALGHALEDL